MIHNYISMQRKFANEIHASNNFYPHRGFNKEEAIDFQFNPHMIRFKQISNASEENENLYQFYMNYEWADDGNGAGIVFTSRRMYEVG